MGPKISDNTAGRTSKARTYPDLLKSNYDADLFEHLVTASLVRIDLQSGQSEEVGTPRMYTQVRTWQRFVAQPSAFSTHRLLRLLTLRKRREQLHHPGSLAWTQPIICLARARERASCCAHRLHLSTHLSMTWPIETLPDQVLANFIFHLSSQFTAWSVRAGGCVTRWAIDGGGLDRAAFLLRAACWPLPSCLAGLGQVRLIASSGLCTGRLGMVSSGASSVAACVRVVPGC